MSQIFSASAPGRLDLLGGVIDYSGGTTLQWPIEEQTLCRVTLKEETDIRLTIESKSRQLCLSWTQMKPFLDTHGLGGIKPLLQTEQHWALYVLGCLGVLYLEYHWQPQQSHHIHIQSMVPESKGVSSSAALEVAVMSAFTKYYHIKMDGLTLSLLCQRVENLAVGVPCGIMDQISTACGSAYHLLPVTCQPAGMLAPLALPQHLGVLGVDSGERHSIGASPYGRARCAAFMAKAWLQQRLRYSEPLNKMPLDYLVNLSPSLWTRLQPEFPQTLTKKNFIQLGLELEDPLSVLEDHFNYPVLAAAEHALQVHHRVQDFIYMIQQENLSPNPVRQERLGILLDLSHEAYNQIHLGSSATDLLALLLRQVPGILGVKITGGGSGGTVAALYQKERLDEKEFDKKILAYQNQTGKKTYLFRGSSAGPWSH